MPMAMLCYPSVPTAMVARTRQLDNFAFNNTLPDSYCFNPDLNRNPSSNPIPVISWAPRYVISKKFGPVRGPTLPLTNP